MKRPGEINLQAALLLKAPKVIPYLRLFRRNVGVVRIEDRVMRFGIAGQCDLYGILRGSRHIEVELKKAGATLTKNQRAWRDWCVEWCVPHLTLYANPGETVDQTVDRWLDEIKAAM